MKQLKLPFIAEKDIQCNKCRHLKDGPCAFDPMICWWESRGFPLRGKFRRYYNFWEER